MTRAHINFAWRDKGELKVLYHYHNGDQYPTGFRDCYYVLDWLKDESAFNPEGFKKWIADNYTEAVMVTYGSDTGASMQVYEHNEKPAVPTEQDHTTISDLTDYTYVFNDNSWTTGVRKDGKQFTENTVQAYNWDEQIFNGTVKEFIKWLEKQEK